MKKRKWIALLSVLMGASIVFAACGDDEGSANNDKPQAAPAVEAKFSNFIKAEYKEDWAKMSMDLTALNEQYGKLEDNVGYLYLFSKSDRTPLDEITTVYTAYNAETKSVVWTREVKYQNGDYSGTDIYGNQKHPEVEEEVWLNNTKVDCIVVSKTTYEKYSKEEMQEQIDELTKAGMPEDVAYDYVQSYKETYSYEYYSVDGKHIATFPLEVKIQWADLELEEYDFLLFGNVLAKFDENAHLIEKWNVETTDKKVYLMETDKYNYTLAYVNGGPTIEIYNKDGGLVYRYATEEMSVSVEQKTGFLQDGDLYTQKKIETESVSYDLLSGGTKYDIVTERIDVETGDIVEIEFPYLIERTYTKDEFQDLLGDELILTENVYNVVKARKIVNGEAGDWVYVFFDNVLNVQYEFSGLIPEQFSLEYYFDNYEIDVLSTGDLLVEIDTTLEINGVAVDRAIVTADGAILSYVPENATIMDKYMVVEGSDAIELYSLDGKLERTFSYPQDQYSDYNFYKYAKLGDGYIWNAKRYNTGTGGYDYITYRIYRETYWYGEDEPSYSFTENTYYDKGEWIEGTESYVIFKNSKGEYEIYNGEMHRVFTSNDKPDVYELENGFVIEVETSDGDVVYEVPFKGNNNDSEKGGA